MQYRILSVGSINADLTACVNALPKLGQTVKGTRYAFATGGKGANCAVAAARLGAHVTFVGRVGCDANAELVLQALKNERIDDRFIVRDPSASTGFALILLDGDGQNSIVVYPEANEKMRMQDLDAPFEAEYDALVMPLEITDDVIYEASARAQRRGIPVVLDTAPAKPVDLGRIAGLHIISPNETECETLTGILPVDDASCREAAKALLAASASRYAVIKLGSRGAYAYGQGVDLFIPAFKVHAVDPTAAGDTFTGALTLAYVRGGDIAGAVRFANAAAALSVTRMGAMSSIPTKKEVEDLLNHEIR